MNNSNPRPRRARLVLAGSAAAAFLVPMAAGAAGGSGAAAAPRGANPNGVLRYGVDLNDTFSNDFDPGTGTNDCSYTELANIYQSVAAPGQYAISGGVARSWTVTDKSTTVTLHLRPGLVFSNGDPVTATAVEDSLTHIKKSPQRSSLSAIQSMTATNPDTLVIHLNRPTAGDFMWAMTYLDGMVMDPTSIPTASTHPVGAGPYVLKSYQEGSSIVLVKNKKYWNAKAYPLNSVDFVDVSALGPQAVSALTSGAVDIEQLDSQQYSEVKNNPEIGISITPSYDYIVLQTRNNRPPFNNAKVRAALEYAINRSTINKVVFAGVGRPAYQPFPTNSPGYNKQVGNRYVYNPKKAKAMLKAAGFPHGVSYKLMVPSGDSTLQRLATIVQSEMDSAGFKVNLQLVPPSDILVDVYINKQGDALLSAELTNGPDISNNFESEYLPTGFGAQFLGTLDTAIAPDILAANASLSPSVQGPLMRKVGAIVMSQGLEVPIEFEPSIIAYNKSVVGGKVVAPIGQCRSNLAGLYVKK
jgi:peptide/nickel transport system substrate-binding protein